MKKLTAQELSSKPKKVKKVKLEICKVIETSKGFL
jgi:hypothetical protein